MADNFVNNSNMTALMTAISNKIAEGRGAYIFKGTVAFASLPAQLTASMTGYTYNVSDAFTTDSRFVEGVGKKYPAGTDVSVANVGTEQTPDMKLNIGVGFFDVESIENRITANTDSMADVFSESESYAAGDVVVYGDSLYKFNTAHAAGAWDGTDADLTTLESLIDAAEPDALTTQQVNALIALLS